MSFIYRITCNECSSVLEYAARMDNDFDLTVSVSPCGACMESLADEKDDEIEDLKSKLEDANEELDKLESE